MQLTLSLTRRHSSNSANALRVVYLPECVTTLLHCDSCMDFLMSAFFHSVLWHAIHRGEGGRHFANFARVGHFLPVVKHTQQTPKELNVLIHKHTLPSIKTKESHVCVKKTCSDRGMAQATGSVHGTPCKSLPLLSSTYTCPLVPTSSGGYAPLHASHLSSTATLAATFFCLFFVFRLRVRGASRKATRRGPGIGFSCFPSPGDIHGLCQAPAPAIRS